ncbi:extracellular solute-binding protein [Cohnella endophytica]|uniref:Extracellular solute-binding protein n=1 Tax=Cohnella endophytica TaxID=2419778 RepID=A0A494XXP8_9BACL|nr:extracellular solute-binding protein [Cohnella endophytica]RKP52889.1 extracellular solute-binding protein [Cohnella endophytica]
MKRKIGIFVIAAILAISMVGCNKATKDSVPSSSSSVAPATNAAETSKPAEKKETKTVVLATISGYYSTALKEAAEAYTKLHPETKVKIDIIKDNAAYKTNFDAKMAAGGDNAPDIVHTNLVVQPDPTEYINKGWLLKLNDFVNEPNPYNDGKTVFEGIDPAYHQNSYDNNGNVANVPFDLVGTGFYYNKDIFDKLGLEAPQTWEDLLADSQKLKDAGYIPLAMPYQSSESWMHTAFIDWSAQSVYPELLILPGDARYDEKVDSKNTSIKYSADNPMFDFGAVYDPEKVLNVIKDKKYDNQGPAEKKWWTTLKDLSQFYEPGYATMDDNSVYSLFISQKAAMFWSGSWQVGTLLVDQQKLKDKSFKWGTFKFPKFAAEDPLFPGSPRGILVPGHTLGITAKKDQEQVERTKDFMKYLYSKDVAQKIFERTLEVGEFVQGPSLVLGVELPAAVNDYLTGFKVAGNMSYALTNISEGVSDDKPASDANRLDFYQGKLTVEKFLENKAKFAQKLADKQIAENKYDLDPKTNP